MLVCESEGDVHPRTLGGRRGVKCTLLRLSFFYVLSGFNFKKYLLHTITNNFELRARTGNDPTHAITSYKCFGRVVRARGGGSCHE